MEKRTVLFVEDERDILRAFEKGLSNEPYDMLFAASSEEALEVLGKHQVHVIVADMEMPGMSGLDLLREVSEKYPDIVRMILTGHVHVDSLLTSINEGEVFRFITKPWESSRELKEFILEAIDHYNVCTNDMLKAKVN